MSLGFPRLVSLPLRGNKKLNSLLWEPGLVVQLGLVAGLELVMGIGSIAASRQ